MLQDEAHEIAREKTDEPTRVIVIDIDDDEDSGSLVTHAGGDEHDLGDAAGAMIPAGVRPVQKYTMRKAKGGKMVQTRRPRMSLLGNSLPPLRANPTMTYTFRYSTNKSGSCVVKLSDIARSMVAASADDSYRYLFRTIRVDSIAVRSNIGDVGQTSTIRLQWLGENTDEILHMDSTMRIDHNACVAMRPPRFSLASFWHDITSSTDDEKQLCRILSSLNGTSPADGVTFIDVTLHVVYDESRYINYVIQDSSITPALNAGGLYYGNLSQTTTNGFIPEPVGRKRLSV